MQLLGRHLGTDCMYQNNNDNKNEIIHISHKRTGVIYTLKNIQIKINIHTKNKQFTRNVLETMKYETKIDHSKSKASSRNHKNNSAKKMRKSKIGCDKSKNF